jgi:hypothetical protein
MDRMNLVLKRLPLDEAVVLPHPDEVGVGFVAAGPIKA